MITRQDNSVADLSGKHSEDDRQQLGEKSNPGENTDRLFGRLTLSMIQYERRKRRGRRFQQFLLFVLIAVGFCGAWFYFLGDPRTFDWLGLWQKVPWPFEQAS